jgi:hypothetical protein
MDIRTSMDVHRELGCVVSASHEHDWTARHRLHVITDVPRLHQETNLADSFCKHASELGRCMPENFLYEIRHVEHF